jgi:hypothetical protein
MQNPGAQPLQQDFYQGANGPGPRQRHLQFDEQDMDYYNKGNRMGRRNINQNLEAQTY